MTRCCNVCIHLFLSGSHIPLHNRPRSINRGTCITDVFLLGFGKLLQTVYRYNEIDIMVPDRQGGNNYAVNPRVKLTPTEPRRRSGLRGEELEVRVKDCSCGIMKLFWA